jgi:glutamyl-tRNA synthetase
LATVVGRLAPSPTGAQHLGNARTYLIAWLSARRAGGQILLRLEDIDSPRVKSGAAQQALQDLRWLGLDWDGEPVIQSTRMRRYADALRILRSRELVYPCICTRTDVQRAASAPHLEHEGPAYPGTCAHRRAGDASGLANGPCAWRFRLPAHTRPFADVFRGPIEIDLHRCGGDFVVWKSAGTPAYQLAVVVDDASMGVTEVLRGDDLISSTPRQLLLYEALDLTSPRFIHVPLVIGEDGRRLAKRHGDTRLSTMRQAGVRSEMVLGWLGWSCGWLPKIEAISIKELLSIFRLESIPREPVVFGERSLRKLCEG